MIDFYNVICYSVARNCNHHHPNISDSNRISYKIVLYESCDSGYCVRVSSSNGSHDLKTEPVNISTFLKLKRIIFMYSRISGELMKIFGDRRENVFLLQNS